MTVVTLVTLIIKQNYHFCCWNSIEYLDFSRKWGFGTQHYSRQLISNTIMNRLHYVTAVVVSYEFHYCSMLTIVAALGAGEAHAQRVHTHML